MVTCFRRKEPKKRHLASLEAENDAQIALVTALLTLVANSDVRVALMVQEAFLGCNYEAKAYKMLLCLFSLRGFQHSRADAACCARRVSEGLCIPARR